MSNNSTSREVAKLDAAMAAHPPVIQWRLDPVRRVQVAWFVDDPYMDGGHNRDKTACKRNHELTEDNTIWDRGFRQCRTCKNEQRKPPTPEQRRRAAAQKRQRRAERQPDIQVEYVECTDPELLAAARTEI